MTRRKLESCFFPTHFDSFTKDQESGGGKEIVISYRRETQTILGVLARGIRQWKRVTVVCKRGGAMKSNWISPLQTEWNRGANKPLNKMRDWLLVAVRVDDDVLVICMLLHTVIGRQWFVFLFFSFFFLLLLLLLLLVEEIVVLFALLTKQCFILVCWSLNASLFSFETFVRIVKRRGKNWIAYLVFGQKAIFTG